MSQENVEIVRRIFDGWNRRDSSTSELIDPDIEYDLAMGIDLDGTYRGPAEIAKVLGTFWGAFEDIRTEIEECLPVGDHVVLGLHWYGRGKRSGVEIDWAGWHVWTLRDGKAVHWRQVRTKREALEAVGLSERDVHADS